MIAQNSHGSDGPPRPLSPQVANELAKAIAAHHLGTSSAESWLRKAVSAVAADAHQKGLRPEELVIALKAIEADVAREIGLSPEDREKFHTMLLQAMLQAYFGDPKGGLRG